jgi:hypothetical protein
MRGRAAAYLRPRDQRLLPPQPAAPGRSRYAVVHCPLGQRSPSRRSGAGPQRSDPPTRRPASTALPHPATSGGGDGTCLTSPLPRCFSCRRSRRSPESVHAAPATGAVSDSSNSPHPFSGSRRSCFRSIAASSAAIERIAMAPVSGNAGSAQLVAVPRLSERPASSRDHWAMGRPLVRIRAGPSCHCCGQPGGESSHGSWRPYTVRSMSA